MQCCETKRNYLRFVLRRLRQAHDGPLDYVYDTIPTDGFYDIHRFRLHAPELYRVYELLYPRDELQLTNEGMAVGGLQLMAMLWSAGGTITRDGPAFHHPLLRESAPVMIAWLRSQGFPQCFIYHAGHTSLYTRGDTARRLAAALLPLLPPYHRKQLLRLGQAGNLSGPRVKCS